MQDNYFFREPATQKKLLDILFIYAKLNPDIGYRQGMHELLAPILWTVDRDALESKDFGPDNDDPEVEGEGLMFEVLKEDLIEHDAFNLFCAVMQTAKSFYEVGDPKEASPVVQRHQELLEMLDPQLAGHLRGMQILPQVYLLQVYSSNLSLGAH